MSVTEGVPLWKWCDTPDGSCRYLTEPNDPFGAPTTPYVAFPEPVAAALVEVEKAARRASAAVHSAEDFILLLRALRLLDAARAQEPS